VAGKASKADVQRVLSEALAPYLGASVAASVVRGYVSRFASDDVSAADIELLLRWIEPGLKVFVGPSRTANVLAELATALLTLQEQRS